MAENESGWPIDQRFPSGKLGLFIGEEVQRLIDSFARCFSVKITIFSARMEEMVVGLQNPGADYCRLIQNRLRLRYRCCIQDKLMCERCERSGDTVIYNCYAGLTEIVVPIKIEEKLIGYGICGQFLTGYRLPQGILDLWIKAGFEEAELRKAYMAAPLFENRELADISRLFSMMLDFIVSRKYVDVRHPSIVEQVMRYIDEHIQEPLYLDDVAAAINYSRSTISHTVKHKLGMNFKSVCILMKIQHFESIIAASPQTSIQKAAASVGYEDPLYFSRLYKKVRLSSPSSYIKSIRNS